VEARTTAGSTPVTPNSLDTCYDPRYTHFRALRVINEDVVQLRQHGAIP